MIALPTIQMPSLRAIGIGLIVITVLLLATALWLTRADLKVAEAENASLAKANALIAGERDDAAESATNWQKAAERLQKQLEDRIAAELVQRERDRAAVEEARQKARDADATFKAWLARYEAATRDAECAAQMQQRLCTR